MVEVASGCGASAAGRGASGVAGLDQVLEVAAGPVSGFGVVVGARAAGDRGDPDAQVAQPGLGGAAARRGVPAGDAAVGGGGAVRVQVGEAPAGARVPGGGGEQVSGVVVVDQAEPVHLGRGPGRVCLRRPGHRDSDQRGQARAGVLAGRLTAAALAGPARRAWAGPACGAWAGLARGAGTGLADVSLAGCPGAVLAGQGRAGVTFLEQVEVGADPQLVRGAGDAGGAQVQGALL